MRADAETVPFCVLVVRTLFTWADREIAKWEMDNMRGFYVATHGVRPRALLVFNDESDLDHCQL